MTYKEFVLLYTTFILGLSFANVFYGLVHVIQEWKNITVDWGFMLSPLSLLMTIVDFWFHAFLFSYRLAEDNFGVFFLFLLPPVMLFFGSLLTFPSEVSRCKDYTQFFKDMLRPIILTYSMLLIFTLLQFYITQFMLDILFAPILLYLLITIIIYITNSFKVYKVLVSIGLFVNLMRWGFEGIY